MELRKTEEDLQLHLPDTPVNDAAASVVSALGGACTLYAEQSYGALTRVNVDAIAKNAENIAIAIIPSSEKGSFVVMGLADPYYRLAAKIWLMCR